MPNQQMTECSRRDRPENQAAWQGLIQESHAYNRAEMDRMMNQFRENVAMWKRYEDVLGRRGKQRWVK